MGKVQLSPTFFRAQLKFLQSDAKEVLYSGAWRAGKSRALCYKMVSLVAGNPKNTVLLVRKTAAHLKKTTLDVLLGSADADAVLPLGTYKHNKVDQSIVLNGGGRIFYGGLNDIMSIRSMSLGAVGVDEAVELDEDEYNELLGRLSLNAGTRQIFLATNPSVPGHWLYKRFFINKNLDREVILARTIDNPFIPEDYLKSLEDLPETLYRRFALGEWAQLEGAIYDNFDRKHNVIKVNKDEKYWNEYYLGIDVGYTDPSCILLIGKNGNRLTVIEEYYKTKVLQDTLIKKISEMYKWCNNPCNVIVDPSQAGLIATLQSLGIPAKGANNDIISGIHLVRQQLEVRNDASDLEINEDAVNLIREMEMYCYKTGTEIPTDKDNHALDALRYIVNEIHDDEYNRVKPVLLSASDDDGVQENIMEF